MSAGKKAGMDMTQGTIWNKILLFALPLAASSMLQQLFNSVDTAVVGRFASSEALAAVGSNGSLISLMINLFIGISLGANVVIAKYIGQKSEENVQAAVHTAIVVALISGVFVMIFGQLIAKPVLTLMGTPDDVLIWRYSICGFIYWECHLSCFTILAHRFCEVLVTVRDRCTV